MGIKEKGFAFVCVVGPGARTLHWRARRGRRGHSHGKRVRGRLSGTREKQGLGSRRPREAGVNHGAQMLWARSGGQAGSHVAWEGAAGTRVGFSSAKLRRGSWRFPGRAAGVERGLCGETLPLSVGGTEHAAGCGRWRRRRPHTQCGAHACIGAWRAQGDGGKETGSARAPDSGQQRGREGTGTRSGEDAQRVPHTPGCRTSWLLHRRTRTRVRQAAVGAGVLGNRQREREREAESPEPRTGGVGDGFAFPGLGLAWRRVG